MSVARALALTCLVLPAGCAHAHLGGTEAVRPAAGSQEQDELDLLLAPRVELASLNDDVVRVVGPEMTCSGTLVGHGVVLTAHHCVVQRGADGELTPALLPVDSLHVELGGDFLPWGNVGLKAVLTPPCGEGGGEGDVAVLVLQHNLAGMRTRSLRREAPHDGEIVDPIGFGRCALSPQGIRRRAREAGPIDRVFPGTFEAQASVCPGDSGGPALDRLSQQVVGVVSLSAMDHDDETLDRSVFARVDEVLPIVAYAGRLADGLEPGVLPVLGCRR